MTNDGLRDKIMDLIQKRCADSGEIAKALQVDRERVIIYLKQMFEDDEIFPLTLENLDEEDELDERFWHETRWGRM